MANYKTQAEIKAARPPNAERVETYKRAMNLQIALHELRERRGITQTMVAEELETSRPNVARIESEVDVRLSTLERYVESLGGHLTIAATFDDETVELAGHGAPKRARRTKG